jgi:hypothetical protein
VQSESVYGGGAVRQRFSPVVSEKSTIPLGLPGTQLSASTSDFPSAVHYFRIITSSDEIRYVESMAFSAYAKSVLILVDFSFPAKST